MATDATGTATSPDNIPTYNTAADDPTGKGLNAIVAAIQTIITQLKAGTLPSGKIVPAAVSWTGAYPFVNADVGAAAAIAVSKLAPGSNGQVLTTTGGVSGWASGTAVNYRKTTSKAVNTTVAATDLLNAEITLGAGVLGTTGKLDAIMWGDFLNNTGGALGSPRLQLVVGGTTVFDTGAGGGGTYTSSALRNGWIAKITCLELGATNSQVWGFDFRLISIAGISATGQSNFTTGNGTYVVPIADALGGFALGTTTSALDMTTSKTFVLNVINANAAANYETRLLGASVDIS